MAATKNPTAVDEEMEIIEYFILDPDDIDDQREEMDQMEVEESNVLFCYNDSNNLSKTINFDHTITRESASYFGNSNRVYSEKSEERSSRNPRGLDESKLSLLHEKNTILTKRGISNNSLTNQTLIDSNQVFSENSDERSSQGCSGLDKSELDLLHEHNELLDNCSICGNSSTDHTILHTIQVFSEKSEERSSRNPIGFDESERSLLHEKNKVLNNHGINNTILTNHTSIDSNQVYSEKSAERSSRNPIGLDESKRGLLHEKHNVLSNRGINNTILTNHTSIHSNQVYSEKSEESSSHDCRHLDESELDLVHENDVVSLGHTKNTSDLTHFQGVNSNHVNFEVSKERNSQNSSDSEESIVDMSEACNETLLDSKASSLSNVSVISTIDDEFSEEIENLSVHESTDFDEFVDDDFNDDKSSESSDLSSAQELENSHDHESDSAPSNPTIDSLRNSDLESEAENLVDNENPLHDNLLDSNNDGQILTESSPIEKPIDISSVITGCRIVDIGHLIKEFTKLGHSKNHMVHCARRGENFHCFKKLDIGLNTLLYWRCLQCRMITTFYTNPLKPETKFDINMTASISVISSASTFAAFQTVLAVFDIPYITNKTYEKHRKKIVEPLKAVVAEEMHLNALKEAEIAIKNGDVTSDGTPYIKAITDGFYEKRSFRGGKHDSLGASVAIIGCATGKIIDIEVLNKYCYTCRRHENRKLQPPPHKCYMNYDRKKSSSSMEPHATAVLFNRSLKLHGLIYKTMVSDDDSGTLKAVRDSEPYKTFGIEVDRIKCSFHIFRSMGNKIREASKMRVPNKRVPAVIRKRIKFSGLRIRQVVTAEIERLRKDFEPDSLSRAEKMAIFEHNSEVLRENILLAPHHVFGDHEKCPREWSCDTSKPNHLIKIKQYGLFTRVEKIITDLSQNAVHLLHFLNTNKIEQYHGILAKYLSGKRIQYGGADEFQDRVYMGTLDHMTSGNHLSRFYKFCKKNVPERIEKLEKERNLQKTINTKSREVIKQTKKSRSTHSGPDKDYGPNATQPDLSETDPNNYEQYKESHHDKLRERQRNRASIEAETRNHPFGEPHGYEKDMIPSHLFGKICSMRETTSCSSVINDICNPFLFHEDVLLTMENNRKKTLQRLESQIGQKIQPCGIVVSHNAESFYLCARPDGLVSNNSIVIIVSVSDDEQSNIEAALASHKNMKNLFVKTDSSKINTKHSMYYMIQGQLYVTNMQFCYFAVYTPNDLKIAEIIHKDDHFWLEKMKMKLNRFYYSALIDEIVDSRLARSLPIREAPFTIEARANKNLEKANKVTTTAQQLSSAPTFSVGSLTNVYDQESLNNYRTAVFNRPIEEYHNNILTDGSLLDDLSISRFLLLLENRNFTIELPITAANPLNQSTSINDLVIIGGQADFEHWCCLHFDGHYVAIYDSLNRNDLKELSKLEVKYLQVRYPQQYNRNEIIFKLVTRQPDNTTCGVYAAAYATTIALGGNPCTINYSQDAAAMREHLFQIICQNQLVEFPCTP